MLDVSEGWDSSAMFDIIVGRLKQLKLYSKNLLYCAADWRRIENLGYEESLPGKEKHIEAATEAEIHDPFGRNMALEMCGFEDPAMIVFRPDKLELLCNHFYDPLPDVPLHDAAVIVFRITSNQF
jgi:hypothetical protein